MTCVKIGMLTGLLAECRSGGYGWYAYSADAHLESDLEEPSKRERTVQVSRVYYELQGVSPLAITGNPVLSDTANKPV